VIKYGLIIICKIPKNYIINDNKIMDFFDGNFVTKKSAKGFQKIPKISYTKVVIQLKFNKVLES